MAGLASRDCDVLPFLPQKLILISCPTVHFLRLIPNIYVTQPIHTIQRIGCCSLKVFLVLQIYSSALILLLKKTLGRAAYDLHIQ